MPRKLAFAGGRKIKVLESQKRPLAPHEVRVRTEFASGKHGTPLAIMSHRNDPSQRWDDEMRLFVPTDERSVENLLAGAPVGASGVGTIVEVGSGVSEWNVGDRVISFLDVSETIIISTKRKLPWQGPPLWLDGCIWHLGDIDPLTALCFEPAFVSFHCICEANVRFADTVAVIGLGAIGLLTVRMAALSGAEQVFAVDPLPKRRAGNPQADRRTRRRCGGRAQRDIRALAKRYSRDAHGGDDLRFRRLLGRGTWPVAGKGISPQSPDDDRAPWLIIGPLAARLFALGR